MKLTAWLVLIAVALAGAAQGQDADGADRALLLRAIKAACLSDATADSISLALPERAGEANTRDLSFGFGLTGHQWSFVLPGDRALDVSRVDSRGVMQRIVADLVAPGSDGIARPVMQARIERQCDRLEGRRLNYAADGRIDSVDLLDEHLQALGKRLLLDPPVPPLPTGIAPVKGTVVALLDTGVNYLQPRIAQRLARDSTGAALGYDYWDDDARPFDVNIIGSPFYPARHGTTLANLLLDLNPDIVLLPLRFPRPDPTRLGDAVDRAAAAGARVLLVGLSSSRGDWRNFRAAVLRHSEMLVVVSAGSEGEDIDDRAVYPAALGLPNQLTIGAADGFGQPVRSNWGRKRVDVLVPAERFVVRDFDGLEQQVGGAEYAATRVAALAARLASAHPDWNAAQLKSAILARARISDSTTILRSAYGVLPDEAFAP
ncbi:MAG: S8 family serine peptidase [Rhodospirillales bacterium]